MNPKPQTFRALIAAIGGASAFAEAMGLKSNTAKKMRDRNSVAVEHWGKLQDVARAHGMLFTSDDFVAMKAHAIPEKPRRRQDQRAAA